MDHFSKLKNICKILIVITSPRISSSFPKTFEEIEVAAAETAG
jgi:hypothetical protein